MISVSEATEKVLSTDIKLKTEKIPITESLGKILAEDIFANEPVPFFDNASIDGFAVRSADIVGADKNYPVRLQLLKESLPAGIVSGLFLDSGMAVQIMTGAQVPQGCDCVVSKDDTIKEGKDVFIFRECKKGENIRYKGTDIQEGEAALSSRMEIRPADIGVMASIGVENILVYQTPVVGILATGDELIPVNQKLVEGVVRNSNSYSLAAQVLEAGAQFKLFGIVRDNKNAIKEKILSSLKECDILLIIGGVSVGDYDYVREILDDIGAEFIFWKVNQHPGKPVAFLTFEDKFIFGLPGNPVSAMVCFELYVRILIKKMSGATELFRKKVVAHAAENYMHMKGREDFTRVKLEKIEDKLYFRLTGTQSAGILTSMAKADGLAIFSEEDDLIEKDKQVEVILLR